VAETDDETFGANLRAMRERKGLSQAALARTMTERGKPWHQQTVAETEAGTRPLRAAEVKTLSQILGSPVAAFYWDPAEVSESQLVYDAGTDVVRSWEAVAEAVFTLMIHRSRAGSVLRQHRRSGYERVKAAIEDVKWRLRECPLEEAIWKGIDLYEHRGERGEGEG
jgi:transcriptional regulator with XRE-family HTH domain